MAVRLYPQLTRVPWVAARMLPSVGTTVALTPPTISYAGSPVSVNEGSAMGNQDPTLDAGDAATSYAITTGSLPAWLSFNTSTGRFSGTPPIGTGGTTVTLGVTAANSGGTGPEADFEVQIGLIVPAISYTNPLTLILGSQVTVSATNTGGAAATWEEVAGAVNVLADFNYQLEADGSLTAIDGTGASPVGDYSVKIRAVNATGNSNTVTLVVHVITASGGDVSAFARSAVAQSAFAQNAFAPSAFG